MIDMIDEGFENKLKVNSIMSLQVNSKIVMTFAINVVCVERENFNFFPFFKLFINNKSFCIANAKHFIRKYKLKLNGK
jgi:hypothetical protein